MRTNKKHTKDKQTAKQEVDGTSNETPNCVIIKNYCLKQTLQKYTRKMVYTVFQLS